MAALTTLAVQLSAALIADRLLGEPRRWHPLVGFGRLAAGTEARLRATLPHHPRAAGVLGVLVLVGVPAAGIAALCGPGVMGGWPGGGPGDWPQTWPGVVLGAAVLYLTLGARSLADHAHAVAAPLVEGNLPAARAALARIVSRDCAALDAPGVAGAACESVLENGHDAVVGALVWFAIAGPGGAVAYRLANTLDAMWGYRNQRYRHFGWAAARLDDALGLLPARVTALAYAACGRTGTALGCWRAQAAHWKSPNAGPVMAAGAGALGIALGGPAVYAGAAVQRPALGRGAAPRPADIARAAALVRRATWAVVALAWAAAAGAALGR